jgi:hypothetical protein
MYLGLLDPYPDSLVAEVRIRILLSANKIVRKTLISAVFDFIMHFYLRNPQHCPNVRPKSNKTTETNQRGRSIGNNKTGDHSPEDHRDHSLAVHMERSVIF